MDGLDDNTGPFAAARAAAPAAGAGASVRYMPFADQKLPVGRLA